MILPTREKRPDWRSGGQTLGWREVDGTENTLEAERPGLGGLSRWVEGGAAPYEKALRKTRRFPLDILDGFRVPVSHPRGNVQEATEYAS